ncbi:YdcH family protein [Brevundimonas balnearis]|uniref:YdcH family protein n=1 Tax=Brevundimonas balnearis TaxID=1572858 RepID=A0ABV6QZL3_9CAUL
MNDDATPIDEETILLAARVKALRQEHADLDASIEALERMPIPDQLLIARMKRRKLSLRDEIVKIEARILPDIIA